MSPSCSLNGVIGNGEPSAETRDTADERTATAIPVPDPDVELPASHPKVGRPSAHDESSSPSGNMFIVPLAPIGGLAANTVVPTGASTNSRLHRLHPEQWQWPELCWRPN